MGVLEEIGFQFVPGCKLAGMGEPYVPKLEETFDMLRDRGVGAVVTLTEDNQYGDEFLEAGFLHFHEPIDDCEAPTTGGMDRILGFIDKTLDEGMGVAVHCMEGRGRTGTVLGTWLGLKNNLTGEEAIDKIYEVRQQSVITWPQREFMVRYLSRRVS